MNKEAEAPSAKEALESLGLAETELVDDVDDHALIEVLQQRGYRVDKPQPVEQRIRLAPIKTKRFRLGIVSDTHLCSKFQQLTYLQEVFDAFDREAVDVVLHGGDLVHGTHKMHRGMEYEMFVHGADAQTSYAVASMPAPPAPGYIISGNHDLSFFKDAGVDVVRNFAEARAGWTYLGPEGAYFEIGGASIYLWHGGSAAYAKSYNMQKWAESVSPEQKPHVAFDGHLHFVSYVHHRNVECFQLPCFQAQTPFEKRKKLTPVVGGLIVDLWVSKHGLEDMQTRWMIKRRPIENDY